MVIITRILHRFSQSQISSQILILCTHRYPNLSFLPLRIRKMSRVDKLLIIKDPIPQNFKLISPKTLQTNNSNSNRFRNNSKRQRMSYPHIHNHPNKRTKIKRTNPNIKINISNNEILNVYKFCHR